MRRVDFDTWEEILLTITRNKTRSVLTAFGIFWGIFMLVALMGGAQGMQDMLSRQFQGSLPIPALWRQTRPRKPTRVFSREGGGTWKIRMWNAYATLCQASMW